MNNNDKKIALLKLLGEEETEENIELVYNQYGGTYSFDNGDEYLVCDNDEAEQYWDESIEQYIDDCVLPEISEQYRSYFDYESFKRDCSFDGRGHTLNSYDGTEYEETVNGTTYFLYQN